MPRELAESVVVITGGSSGIGRAAAHEFARAGAHLVLAARAEAPLEAAAAECRALGAEAVAVPADVRDEAAVAGLAQHAVQRFGRLDVWVNGAGVIAYGRFEDLPAEVFRQVLETNLFGQVHGARAALAQFRRQGSGVIIALGSVWGRATTPQVSPYVTSKFAIRAFSECLRQELRDEPGIHVATILPEAVDTPIFHQAANFSERPVRPIPPLLDPEDVARSILACARDPKREVTFGRAGRMLELAHSLTPHLYGRFAPTAFTAGNYGRGSARPSPGNVLAPEPAGERIYGGWRRERRRELVGAMLAAAGGAVRGLVRGR